MTREKARVIGLSCRFPESDGSEEFFENLASRRDMVTVDDRRWKPKEEFPDRFGKIKQSLDTFDYKFFTIHPKQAERVDPQLRLLLEVSYEALVDAGISLEELKGTKTGVYIGSCTSDALKAWSHLQESISGYEIMGCADSMLANRLSFFYDLHGPSESIDTACSSSLVALHRAVNDLESGQCEYAIVGGSSIILWPNTTYSYLKLKMLSPDGMCKTFDQSANGFARAEGVGVIILTNKMQTRYKPYAQILSTGVGNGGWNPTGITFPSGKEQKNLYREVCEKAGLQPKEIDYLEAHGTGTVAGDGEELEAIYDVYGKENRDLIIGSVKSNMGHAEGAAGIAGLIKVLLCLDQETLVPNLHLKTAHEKLQSMRVLTDPLVSWKGSKVAISSFGFGGTNAHAILKKWEEPENEPLFSPPFLTFLAHRTKEGLYELKNSLQAAQKGAKTEESQKISSQQEGATFSPQAAYFPNLENKQKLPYREVLQLGDDPEVSSVADSPDSVYLVCSGNGSQWKGMGAKLYAKLPLFQETIDRCSRAVKKELFPILSGGAKSAGDDTIALSAVQIGLIESIKSFGVTKEKIGGFLGHSAGEIVCSYLDGLTSLEETMQIAEIRGRIANLTGEHGQMAALGLSYEEAAAFIQEEKGSVCIACINSPRNVTISGEKGAVIRLVKKAEEKDLFCRILQTHSKAYHSSLFKEYKELLGEELKKIFAERKLSRSGKWHTTVAGEKTDLFDWSYHVNAVLEPVDFQRAMQQIPQNAIVLEIGPHSVLRTLVAENRPDLKYAALMKKEEDDWQTFKEGVGKLWKYGIAIQCNQGPKWNLERPPLKLRKKWTSWDHSENLPVPRESDFTPENKGYEKVVFNLSQEKDAFLKGHVIDEKIILPATSYFYAMWSVFQKKNRCSFSSIGSYAFTHFEIFQVVQVEKDSVVELEINQLGNQYEALFKKEVVARVKIEFFPEKNTRTDILKAFKEEETPAIDKENFYRIVANLGYGYQGSFQVIEKLNVDCEKNRNYAVLKWEKGNWIAFLDGIFQSMLLPPREDLSALFVPVRIRSILINPKENEEASSSSDRFVVADFHLQSIYARGVEISGMEMKQLARKPTEIKNKVNIKRASSFVYYGLNVIEDENVNEYSLLTSNYSVQLARELIYKNNLQDTGHYRRILESFDKWGQFTPVDPKQVERYASLQSSIGLRMLEDIYRGDVEEFLKRPLSTVTQHKEYGRFYFEDSMISLQDRSFVLKYLSIVRDHISKPELNILEIGTGTGGFTRLIEPYLVNDRYIATDITEHLQISPDVNLSHLDLSYKKFNLDSHEEYKILKENQIDLVVASNSLHTGSNIDRILQSVYDNLNEGSFLLFYENHSPYPVAMMGMDHRLWAFEDEREMGLWISQKSWLVKLKQTGFQTISYVSDKYNLVTLFLVRKKTKVKWDVVRAPSFDGFATWHAKIKNCTEPTLLVSNGLDESGSSGLIRTLNRETQADLYHCLLSDQDINEEVIEEAKNYGMQVSVFREGRLGVYCDEDIDYKIDTKADLGFYANFTQPGDFSSYRWVNNPPPRGVAIKASYSALNFKDVMIVSGKLGPEAFLGLPKEQGPNGSIPREYVGIEFSGRDLQGNRYMGIHISGITNIVDAPKDWIIPIPDHISDEEAATIPTAYGTAYLALFERANLQPDQSVLIHSGAGGVGLAAIRLALSLGCKVFTTCHQSKKGFLLQTFRELEESAILDSRTTDFEYEILRQTEGRGVDIILNSLSDDKLQASLRCLAFGGQFLEIGKQDIMSHSSLDLYALLKGITVHGVHFHQEIMKKSKAIQLFSRLKKGLEEGVVKPLPTHVFDYTQVDQAFRFMASGKHKGKVLIDLRKMDRDPSPSKTLFYEDPKENGYYLITGGLGGFGLSLIQWLFQRGVRKFLVTSRRGVATGEQDRVLHLLRHKGAEIVVSTKDVGVEEEAKELIASVKNNIRAVFHLAMILDDGIFRDMTKEKWERAVRIKAKGAIYLDSLTRLPSVKHFVAFSSLVSRYGSVGQSNYSCGNGVMEEVCRLRLKSGHHALAIQWGVIDNVGFVANNAHLRGGVETLSAPIGIHEALDFIDALLVSRINSHCVQFSAEHLKRGQTEETKYSFSDVMREIEHITKLDLMKCAKSSTLEYFGVDSLQVVEIQTILIKSLREVLPLKTISSMKIKDLRDLIEQKLGGGFGQKGGEETSSPSSESMLLRELSSHNGEEGVYLFLGLGVSGLDVKFPKDPRFDLYLVQWQATSSLEELAQKIEEDVLKKGYKKVTFLTHSAGYHIAKAVMRLNGKIDRLISISLISDKINHSISLGNLEALSDADFEKAYKNFAFFVEGHLPVHEIKRQMALLKRTSIYDYIPPHLILNPVNDLICDRSRGGVDISGTHQFNSFKIEELYANL